ncbi:hypothetical protein [Niabella hirudinis]
MERFSGTRSGGSAEIAGSQRVKNAPGSLQNRVGGVEKRGPTGA